jgi:high affinity Mn2+ porin
VKSEVCAGLAATVTAFAAVGAWAQEPAAAPEPLIGNTDAAAVHFQATVVEQYHPAFRSPYKGPQSLDPGARGEETTDLTAFLGYRLWAGGEVWFDPEIDQGFGLSDTLGVEDFTSAEAYKIGRNAPYLRVQRLFFRQTIGLGGDRSDRDQDLNVLSGKQSADRLVVTVGKVGVPDVFDTNKYAGSARTDFMNWGLVNTATFDYAADSWGYTYGGAAELYQGPWTARFGVFDLSGQPNSQNLDKTFHQYAVNAELERRYTVFGRDGAIRATGFLNRGRMGRYDDASALSEETGDPADIALVRHYHSRTGLSANWEQAVTETLGLFARVGHADGRYEGYEFTDISTTAALGVSSSGAQWGRKSDVLGFAGILSSASQAGYRYFNAGGLGILAGDGLLKDPGSEKVIETYYRVPLGKISQVTVDYQFVDNPAFNRDRGPTSVFSVRVHAQL